MTVKSYQTQTVISMKYQYDILHNDAAWRADWPSKYCIYSIVWKLSEKTAHTETLAVRCALTVTCYFWKTSSGWHLLDGTIVGVGRALSQMMCLIKKHRAPSRDIIILCHTDYVITLCPLKFQFTHSHNLYLIHLTVAGHCCMASGNVQLTSSVCTCYLFRL